jgi:hypothetical protein
MIPGSRSGPKSNRARIETIKTSGTENTRWGYPVPALSPS